MKYTLDDLRDDISREFGGGHVSASLTKRFKGGGGGDGGASERKAAEDARIATAIKQLNEVFGVVDAKPEAVDKNNYYVNQRLVSGRNNMFGGKTPEVWENVASNNQPVFSGPIMGIGQSNQAITRKVFDQASYDAALKASQDKANSLKAGAQARENLYTKIGTDAKNVAMTDLNKERGISERELKFSLARNGLSGGSRDIDSNRDVLDTYQQGVLKASNIGSQTANEARSSDEKTRVNLINSIQAGLTSGDAVQQAYAGMSNNAAAAQDAANSASLAGFFDVLRQQQANNQYQKGVDSVYVPGMTAKTKSNSMRSDYDGTVRSVQ